jgi:hypothetical protein
VLVGSGRGVGVLLGLGREGGDVGGGGSQGGAPATPQLGGGTGVHAAPVAGSTQSDWA